MCNHLAYDITRTYLTSVRTHRGAKIKRIFLQQHCAPNVYKFQQSTHQDHEGRLSNEVRYTTRDASNVSGEARDKLRYDARRADGVYNWKQLTA